VLGGGGAARAAADRPSEEDMFGGGPPAGTGGAGGGAAPAAGGGAARTTGPSTEPHRADPAAPGADPAGATGGVPAATVAPTASPEAASSRDTDLLGDPSAGPKLSPDVAPDDPLKIGGRVYLRALYSKPGSAKFDLSNTSGSQIALRSYTTFSAPSLVDAYFDARPNSRVRGFVLGRMFFDPTLPATSAPATGTMASGSMAGSGSMMMTPAVNPAALGLSGVANTRGPTTLLDQLWLRFDIARTVFVTAGRQHVKWGTGRFWTPTDFLHPEHRNPVAVFDARPGFTMLKLDVPWEERGWNFYAFGLVEGVRNWDKTTGSYPAGSDTVSTLGQLGGAVRAEVVLGAAELGLDAVTYANQKPRYGADLSFGVGDFDLYVDAGFRYGSEIPRVMPTTQADGSITYPIGYSTGIKPQIAAGGTYSLKYNDNDVFTLAGEYFYNTRGYSDPHVYPQLFLTGTFEFFYTGRHYAAVSAILNAPWSWNYSNFSFTTVGNLSDQSFFSRVDYSYTLLTHMTFELFGAVNYGRREGEFRLGVDNLQVGNLSVSLSPQAFSVGTGLRISI
jgi:hypothetical protein